MKCIKFEMLNGLTSENQKVKFISFLSSLKGDAKNNVTATKVMSKIGCSYVDAAELLDECLTKGLVEIDYSITCPHCSMIVKRVEEYKTVLDSEVTCYSCCNEFNVSLEDVESMYRLLV